MSKYCPAEREYPFPLSHRKKQLRKNPPLPPCAGMCRQSFLSRHHSDAPFQSVSIFIFLAQFAGINQDYFVSGCRLIKEQHTDIRTCIGKHVAWHGNTAEHHFVIYNFMKNFILNTTFSRDKTCRNDNCTFACLFSELITC